MPSAVSATPKNTIQNAAVFKAAFAGMPTSATLSAASAASSLKPNGLRPLSSGLRLMTNSVQGRMRTAMRIAWTREAVW